MLDARKPQRRWTESEKRVGRVVERVSVHCPAMAMVLWGSSLNSMLPPQKPTEVDGDQELPQAFPLDDCFSDGGEPLPDGEDMCR